jgi:hypothetical protein
MKSDAAQSGSCRWMTQLRVRTTPLGLDWRNNVVYAGKPPVDLRISGRAGGGRGSVRAMIEARMEHLSADERRRCTDPIAPGIADIVGS